MRRMAATLDPKMQNRSWEERLNVANAASEAKEWQRAATLWEALRAASPHDSRCWLKTGEAWCEAREFDSADRVLQEAVSRFPDDHWIAHCHAVVARRRADWPEMLRRAERLRQDFPDFWPGWIETADALAGLGRHSEAGERRRETAERFPDEFWPNYGAARFAAKQTGGTGAVHIWSEFASRFPAQPAATQALAAAVEALKREPTQSGVRDDGQRLRAISNAEYRCPTDLRLNETRLNRVMVIGSCLSGSWPEILESRHPGCVADHFLVNNSTVLPEAPPHPAEEYDFHVVQIHLRKIMREHEYFRLADADPAAAARLFETARGRLSDWLAELMRWNQAHGILTFVCNFLVPQQNPMGRLLPRYDLRNFVHFVEKLNEALAEEVRRYNNAYFFDVDQILSTYGRRYFQDDAVWTIAHGAALSDGDWEEDGDFARVEVGVTRGGAAGLSFGRGVVWG